MAEIRAESLKQGQRLKGYVIESVLGEGGFSTTYLARHTGQKKNVTIREYLPRDIAGRTEDGRVAPTSERVRAAFADGLERFLRKARKLSSHSAENGGRVLDCFESNGTAYLVMDYRRGDARAPQPVAPEHGIAPEPRPEELPEAPAAEVSPAALIDIEDTVDAPAFDTDDEQWTAMLADATAPETTLAEPVAGAPAPPAAADAGSTVPPPPEQTPETAAPRRHPPGRSRLPPSPRRASHKPPRRIRMVAASLALLILAVGAWFLADRLIGPGTDRLVAERETPLSAVQPEAGAKTAAPDRKAATKAAAQRQKEAADEARRRKEALARAKLDEEKRRAEQARREAEAKTGQDSEQAFRRGDEQFHTVGNYAEAFKWYRKAAEQGHARAQFALGHMYDIGKGVERDAAAAVQWFRRAAEQGHVDAQYNLAFMYANGAGVAKDYAEGLRWFRKAAARCDIGSQANIGFMYEKGWGVDRDPAEAYFWYRLAAATHAKNPAKTDPKVESVDPRLEGIAIRAGMAADRVQAQLTDAQERDARTRVANWKAAPGAPTPAWCQPSG